jgi:2-dehydro-3-deoxy-D-gluconate 5-dehydrogenase
MAATVDVLESFRLNGRTALVTGAATGLGAAVAIALAQAGAAVACHGNRRPATETADHITANGGTAAAFAADLSDPNGAQQLFEKVTAHFPQIDILVNNAGTIYREAAEDHSLLEW